MATRRSALGRGLGALITSNERPVRQDTGAPGATPDVVAGRVGTSGRPLEIAVDRIDPNPDQPRRRFEESELVALAESIQRHGVLQPVVVRQAGERYELVVGERRWRAARLAGRTTLPAVVADFADRALLEVALVENVQRRDLNPIELALAFEALADAGATQEAIGERVGLDRSTVANHIRLLELPREIQEDVEGGRLTLGHGKALLQVDDAKRQNEIRERIKTQGLSVRDAERLARRPDRVRGGARAAAGPGVDPDLRSLVDSLRSHLQTKVELRGGAERGRLEIEFYSPAELHRVTSLILDRT